jgi:uncharacterized protein (UPF0264 family)
VTPRLLASVRSVDEARVALAARVDVIDLKEPVSGALGAVAHDVARAVVTFSRREPGEGRATLVSATIGDVPFSPAAVVPAVRAMAAAGVDIVKVGLFAGDTRATLAALRVLARDGIRLVAVMFADRAPEVGLLPDLRDAGFLGAMLDTAEKRSGGLRRHLDDAALARFVAEARRCGLLCGLAGSLRIDDIAPLAALGPDYLGFRGALCRAGRDGTLDPALLAAVAKALRSTASSATATAGRARAVPSRPVAEAPRASTVPAST